MNIDEVLKLFLILGVIGFISCFAFITYHFVKTLKAVTNLANGLAERSLSTLPSLLFNIVGKLIRRRR